jgi:hypothetical protein
MPPPQLLDDRLAAMTTAPVWARGDPSAWAKVTEFGLATTTANKPPSAGCFEASYSTRGVETAAPIRALR